MINSVAIRPRGLLFFEEITPIFRCLKDIDETQEIGILPYPH